jgi:hypothetical protein
MRNKRIKSKIDDAVKIDDPVKKDEGLVARVGARLAKVAEQAVDVAAGAGSVVEGLARKGEHRLQESTEKAGHLAKQIASRAIHSAQETAEKVVHGAKEQANKAEHRRQELAGTAGDKPKGE